MIKVQAAGPGAGAVADHLACLSGHGLAAEELCARTAASGAMEAEGIRITAWFPPGMADPAPGLARLGSDLLAMDLLTSPLAVESREVEEEDWMEVFRSQHGPVRVSNRLAVRPSWCPPVFARAGSGKTAPAPPPSAEMQRAYPPEPWRRREIVIDPGLAFGVGNHPTTRLTLYLLDQAIGIHPPARFLDLGTGTGILAIAASLLGVPLVAAVDNDPIAVETARDNAGTNGAGDIRFVTGTIENLAGEDRPPFDLIAANLSAPVLERTAPALAAALAPHGRLLVSGITEAEAEGTFAAFAAAGLVTREILRDGGWVAAELAGH
jgi:ribosomal protein L11 methylase PrmA